MKPDIQRTNPSSPKRWSFDPDLPEKRKYRRSRNFLAWVAPEHQRVASSMTQDYPRDDFGRVIPGTKKNLVLDKRPAILIPPRKTYNPF